MLSRRVLLTAPAVLCLSEPATIPALWRRWRAEAARLDAGAPDGDRETALAQALLRAEPNTMRELAMQVDAAHPDLAAHPSDLLARRLRRILSR